MGSAVRVVLARPDTADGKSWQVFDHHALLADSPTMLFKIKVQGGMFAIRRQVFRIKWKYVQEEAGTILCLIALLPYVD